MMAAMAQQIGAPRPEIVERARELAEEVLIPGAAEADSVPLLPVARLDALAAAGLHGLLGPRSAGGLEADPPTYHQVIEELARGCVTTAFVFAQHHSAVRAVALGPAPLRARWLAPLCRGKVRAGVAFSGLRRTGPPPLVATLRNEVVVLEGQAPFVSGWGLIDVVHVAARTPTGAVLWCLVDAQASPSLVATPLSLGALGASGTVVLRFHGHAVSAERITALEPFADWQARDARGLRSNGSHALGLARRCAELSSSARLAAEIAACRHALDTASADALPDARAAASLLALRAAARLVAQGGGGAMVAGSDAERLFRQAGMLLVFGQTPTIRQAMLERIDAEPATLSHKGS